LIFRDIYINVSDPQQIQLWIMAGANRMVHAGASLHEKGGFSIGGQWVSTGAEHIDVGNLPGISWMRGWKWNPPSKKQ